ncbi:hypothetical protein [Leifsonia sp. 21MFCrub1.1]|uniref:hypothetical protein n=1 Tax=Leifsonia sp. 21MFCrub1.1 TaxID=1798223 RepID=UPI000B7E8E82|nr:hypothetical protein [Leifsonia sp. 21MFCrub1.1]
MTFQVLAGPARALELNGGHFPDVPTRQRAEDVAELRESEKSASHSDLRLGEGRVLGSDA